MIRTPRTEVYRCTCGLCRTCRDPLVQHWSADVEDHRARWRRVDLRGNHRTGVFVTVPSTLVARQMPARQQLVRPAPDLDGFGADMAALNARVRGDGAQPRTSERGGG